MNNRTFLKSVLEQKCPKCRTGLMFESSTYNLTKFDKMNSSCPVCKQDFVVEPGFYTGAMYFSYAINVAIVLFLGLGTQLIFNPNIFVLVSVVTLGVILAVPFTFRYSRLLMIYLFSGINFDENKIQQLIY